MASWYILWPFGIFFPALVYCPDKNLATLFGAIVVISLRQLEAASMATCADKTRACHCLKNEPRSRTNRHVETAECMLTSSNSTPGTNELILGSLRGKASTRWSPHQKIHIPCVYYMPWVICLQNFNT
jgi:hypothetical protein